LLSLGLLGFILCSLLLLLDHSLLVLLLSFVLFNDSFWCGWLSRCDVLLYFSLSSFFSCCYSDLLFSTLSFFCLKV
jgi:hypothetical protein